MSQDDLERFVDAQDDIYDRVVAELRAGRKTSHWMWFVFPQIAGLGRSPTAVRYAISGARRRGRISRIRCSGRGCASARESCSATAG